jgi:hypothetical protein
MVGQLTMEFQAQIFMTMFANVQCSTALGHEILELGPHPHSFLLRPILILSYNLHLCSSSGHFQSCFLTRTLYEFLITLISTKFFSALKMV